MLFRSRGTIADAVEHVESTEPRGEYALVIEPAPSDQSEVTDDNITAELRSRLATGLSKRDAVDEVTTALGIARKRVYDISIGL